MAERAGPLGVGRSAALGRMRALKNSPQNFLTRPTGFGTVLRVTTEAVRAEDSTIAVSFASGTPSGWTLITPR